MLKKEIRTVFRQKRKGLTPIEQSKKDDLILIQFQTLQLPFLSVVLNFYPISEYNEIDTFPLIDYLEFRNPGLQVAYPKTDFITNSMQAIICTDEELFEKNKQQILEPTSCEAIAPSSIDLVLIPLLAFDQRGYRVGYGKGFYDRYLQQCRKDCLKVGLSYFEPIDLIQDTNEFDVPLDFCITPQKAYVF